MKTDQSYTLARKSDPASSHAAASKPRRTALIRKGVLLVLADGIARTLDEIVEDYRLISDQLPWASDSSIRTRAAELRRDGLIERVESDARRSGRSRLGNPAGLYRATTVQSNSTGGQSQ